MKKVIVGVVALLCLMACSTPKKPIQMVIEKPVQIMRVMSVTAPTASSQIKVFERIPDSFDDSSWQLLQVRGQRMSLDSAIPTLYFKAGALTGFSGCKQIYGSYQRDAVDLWVTGFYVDNQPCNGLQAQHELVEWMLMQVRSIRIIESNGFLALLDNYHNLLAELKPVKQVP